MASIGNQSNGHLAFNPVTAKTSPRHFLPRHWQRCVVEGAIVGGGSSSRMFWTHFTYFEWRSDVGGLLLGLGLSACVFESGGQVEFYDKLIILISDISNFGRSRVSGSVGSHAAGKNFSASQGVRAGCRAQERCLEFFWAFSA